MKHFSAWDNHVTDSFDEETLMLASALLARVDTSREKMCDMEKSNLHRAFCRVIKSFNYEKAVIAAAAATSPGMTAAEQAAMVTAAGKAAGQA